MDATQDLGEQVAAGSRPVTAAAAAAAVSSTTGADEPASAEECLDIAVADTEDALELLAAAAGGEETAPGSTLTRAASVSPAAVAGIAAAHVTSGQPATARAAATRTVREGALPRAPAAAGAAGTSAAAAGARSAGALHSAACKQLRSQVQAECTRLTFKNDRADGYSAKGLVGLADRFPNCSVVAFHTEDPRDVDSLRPVLPILARCESTTRTYDL